ELIETERYYVRNLEILQQYATALSESALFPPATIYRLFSNIAQLFAFQRKFLIGLEETYKLPWQEQQWGRHFIDAEEEFEVIYGPYCANWYMHHTQDRYSNTNCNPSVSNRVVQMRESLAVFNNILHISSVLPTFLVWPVSRVCKYPLLIKCLLQVCSADTYRHYDELKSAVAAVGRVTDRLSDAQLKADNEQTVVSLWRRVADWRGLQADTFGAFLLDDVFVVSRADVKRQYHVFLFEGIILFCADAPSVPPAYRNGRPQRLTPLRLKGHILLSDVMQIQAVETRTAPPIEREWPLDIWWNGKHGGHEVLTLCIKWEDKRSTWEMQVRRLIRECAERRADHQGSLRRRRRTSMGQDKGG
ncbi:Dbl homology domain-containing protein, partial [Mycena capillaripes]